MMQMKYHVKHEKLKSKLTQLLIRPEPDPSNSDVDSQSCVLCDGVRDKENKVGFDIPDFVNDKGDSSET